MEDRQAFRKKTKHLLQVANSRFQGDTFNFCETPPSPYPPKNNNLNLPLSWVSTKGCGSEDLLSGGTLQLLHHRSTRQCIRRRAVCLDGVEQGGGQCKGLFWPCRSCIIFLLLFPTYTSILGSPLPVPPSYPATACFPTPPQSLLREEPVPRSQLHSCSSHRPGLRAAQLPSHHCCQSRREQPGACTGWAPSLMQPRKAKAFTFVGRKEMFLQPCLLCHSPTVLLSLEVLGTFPHLVNK